MTLTVLLSPRLLRTTMMKTTKWRQMSKKRESPSSLLKSPSLKEPNLSLNTRPNWSVCGVSRPPSGTASLTVPPLDAHVYPILVHVCVNAHVCLCVPTYRRMCLCTLYCSMYISGLCPVCVASTPEKYISPGLLHYRVCEGCNLFLGYTPSSLLR